ncbi:hypothetical protein [Actinomyces oris]|uniref:hypothetical protein n=1 Tax=Actinomyces oris TaxID=544580 RepID=UPI0028D7DFF3|nr:hypothetical protein [Actinomyces oris]
MLPTPDAAENSTDQPDTDPGTQPGTADSGDDALKKPDKGEAEDRPGRNATEADRASTNAGDSEGKTEGGSEGEAFPPRGVLTLRALRWGGVLAMFASSSIAKLLSSIYRIDIDVLHMNSVRSASDLATQPIVAMFTLQLLLWSIAAVASQLRRTATTIIASLIALLGAATTGINIHHWMTAYERSGISIPIFLCYTAETLGFTTLICTSIILHRVRTLLSIYPRQLSNPARWRKLYLPARPQPGENNIKVTKQAPLKLQPLTKIKLAAISLTPIIALSLLTSTAHYFVTPFTHNTSSAPHKTPSIPTTIDTKTSWVKDMAGVDRVIAGSTGPIVISSEGITALEPSHGSTLWEYGTNLHTSFAFTSPNRNYLALRARIPDDLVIDSDDYLSASTPPETTLVFDTRTGAPVIRHMSRGGTLQLTDSTLLDGDTAYSLKDGRKLWSNSDAIDTTFMGAAGHSTFIVSTFEQDIEDTDEEKWTGTSSIAVAPDTNPSTRTHIDNLLIDPIVVDNSRSSSHKDYMGANPVIISGWTAQFTNQSDENGNPTAQAINIDQARKADSHDIDKIPLGAASGINEVASTASQTLSTYPYYGSDKSIYDIITAWNTPRVATVFTPTNRTATPAAHYPGLASAHVGIAPHPSNGSIIAHISLRPSDGSPELTIPVSGNTIDTRPLSLSEGVDQLMADKEDHQRPYLEFTGTPGCTTILLDISGPSEDSSTYRLYGITERNA